MMGWCACHPGPCFPLWAAAALYICTMPPHAPQTAPLASRTSTEDALHCHCCRCLSTNRQAPPPATAGALWACWFCACAWWRATPVYQPVTDGLRGLNGLGAAHAHSLHRGTHGWSLCPVDALLRPLALAHALALSRLPPCCRPDATAHSLGAVLAVRKSAQWRARSGSLLAQAVATARLSGPGEQEKCSPESWTPQDVRCCRPREHQSLSLLWSCSRWLKILPAPDLPWAVRLLQHMAA